MWIKICGMTTPEAGDAGAAEIGADVATRMSSALSWGHAGDMDAGLAPGEDAAHSVPGPGSKERN